jgi:hypothetical protein
MSSSTIAPSTTERVRYFARQLLTADDLTQEQEYLRGRMRRHNLFLHGWGVVCGAAVRATTTDWTVTIDPGYVLGPQGDEILIDSSVTVDLSRQDLAGNAAAPCADPLDPWCSSVRVIPPLRQTLYLAVGYNESATRPVRVQSANCGCDGGCEYSRTRDGYVVRLLTALPGAYSPMADPLTGTACPGPGVRPCPTPPPEPWVILATITPRDQTIADTDIDNFTLRRNAATFADWWYACGAGSTTPPPTPSPTPTPSPGPSPSPTPSPAPGVITVQSLAFDPTAVAPGGSSTGTVTLSGPAPGNGQQVALASDSPSVASVPNTVTVQAGGTSATFGAATQAVGVARVTATVGSSTAQATLTVRRSKNPLEKTQVDKVQLEKVTDKVQREKISDVAKSSDIIRQTPVRQIQGPTGHATGSATAQAVGSRVAFIQPAERPDVGTVFLNDPSAADSR